MVKLSISLPNNTQITLESEESEVVQDVLGMVLRGLPLDTMFVSVQESDPDHEENGAGEKSMGATTERAEQSAISPSRRANGSAPREDSNGEAAAAGSRLQLSQPTVNGTSAATPAGESGDYGLDLDRQPHQFREDYTAFCQSVNPMGDMRRVVVAAEAANRFFGAEGVSADDLGELFDLAGWRRANSFTQTLRNAARSKFGWLERIPGRAGRYAATDLGRSTTLAG